MSLTITGLGTALPRFSIPTPLAGEFVRSFCCKNAEQAEQLQSFFANSEVRRRHFAILKGECRDGRIPQDFYRVNGSGRGPSTARRMQAFAEYAPPLAIEAARNAVADAGISPKDVTHLITISSTGFVAPGVEFSVMDALSLRPSVDRTQIGFMGCHGSLNGLKAARGCLAVEPNGCVLMCAVELNSLHFYSEWNPEKVVASALFSDGAGAAIFHHSDSTPWRMTSAATVRIPDARDAITLTIGDHGFEMGLSRWLPQIIEQHLGSWVANWLDQQGLSLSQVGSWAIHPGGPKILEAVEKALSLPEDALDHSRAILADCGNMVSPTVLFVLDRMRQVDAPRPCVAMSFGPGLVAEAALFL